MHLKTPGHTPESVASTFKLRSLGPAAALPLLVLSCLVLSCLALSFLVVRSCQNLCFDKNSMSRRKKSENLISLSGRLLLAWGVINYNNKRPACPTTKTSATLMHEKIGIFLCTHTQKLKFLWPNANAIDVEFGLHSEHICQINSIQFKLNSNRFIVVFDWSSLAESCAAASRGQRAQRRGRFYTCSYNISYNFTFYRYGRAPWTTRRATRWKCRDDEDDGGDKWWMKMECAAAFTLFHPVGLGVWHWGCQA